MKMTRVVLVALVAVLGWQQVAAHDSTQCYSAGFLVERARPNLSNNTIGPGKIEFENVVVDNGSWSPTDNVFTAPCTGLFNFSYEAKSTEHFVIQLIKNEEAQATAYGNDQQPMQESNTVNLEKGDIVYLYLVLGTIIETPDNKTPNTHFKGEFIPPVSKNCYSAGVLVEKAKPDFINNTIGPGKIEFENVVVNDGTWSPTDNVFTAPCTGLFTFTLEAKSTEYFVIQLIKNEEAQATAYGNDQQPMQESNTVNLEKGDIVYLYLVLGTIIETPDNKTPNTHFKGEFIPPVSKNCYSAGFLVERARPNLSNNTIGPGKIEFENVVVDNGSWSPTDNVFTAPCTGLFNFSYEAKSTEHFVIQLIKNEEAQATAYGNDQQPMQESNTVNLEKGDIVYLYLVLGTIIETPDNKTPNTHFKGEFIPPVSKNCYSAGVLVEKAKPDFINNTIGPGKIEFENVVVNDGTWSPTDNVFTAPCTGLFTFTLEAKSTEYFVIQLIKNREIQAVVYGNDQHPVNECNILNLEIGDRVYLYLAQGTIIETPYNEAPNTYFSGHIMRPVTPRT